MAYKKPQEVKEAYEFPKYTEQDFIQLNVELDKYRVKKVRDGKQYFYMSREALNLWLRDKRAIDILPSGEIVVLMEPAGEDVYVYPTRYQLLMDKYNKFTFWNGRRERELDSLDRTYGAELNQIANDKQITEA